MRIDDFPGVKFATYLHDFSLHFPVLCSYTALEVVKHVMCAPQNVPSSPRRKAARASSTRVIRSSRRNPSRLELYLTRTSLHFVIKYLSTIATIVSWRANDDDGHRRRETLDVLDSVLLTAEKGRRRKRKRERDVQSVEESSCLPLTAMNFRTYSVSKRHSENCLIQYKIKNDISYSTNKYIFKRFGTHSKLIIVGKKMVWFQRMDSSNLQFVGLN